MSKGYTKAQVLDAIKTSGGIVSHIAQKLGCEWHTADKYINKWDVTKQAIADEENGLLDISISEIVKSIKSGNTQDAKWYLSKKGKNRGFDDNSTVNIANEEGKPFEIKHDVDLSKLNDKQLRNLIQIAESVSDTPSKD